MSDHHSQLRVLTLNVWGLKYISKERPPRIAAIIDHIVAVCEGRDTVDGDHSRRPYDVVCLQECWIFADYEQIREGTRHILPESRFFKRYVFALMSYAVPCFQRERDRTHTCSDAGCHEAALSNFSFYIAKKACQNIAETRSVSFLCL